MVSATEGRGRFWLAVFTLPLAVVSLGALVLALTSLGQGTLTWRGVLLPVCQLWLLGSLWNGEPWIRIGAIVFYGLSSGLRLGPWLLASAAAWAATPAEQSAAGRQIFLTIMLPVMAPFLILSAWELCLVALLAFSPSIRAFQAHQLLTANTLLDTWREWRKTVAGSPTFREAPIGEVQVHSGTLLLADPMYIQDPLRIEGLPHGRFPVFAKIIRYPEGGQRIARVTIALRPGARELRETLGRIGVDSATVIAVDEQSYKEHWREVGTERIGRTGTPDHNREVAELIEAKFGLRWRPVSGFECRFIDPISEEMEQRITAYLETFPEYADYSFMYFRVETKNTFERISDAMCEDSWSEVALDPNDGSEQTLFAFASGFGDGSYDVVGLYRGDELVGIEIIFIGPEQDKILEAFPFLRESQQSDASG